MPALYRMLDTTKTSNQYINDIQEQNNSVVRNYHATIIQSSVRKLIAIKKKQEHLKRVTNTTTIQSAFRRHKTKATYKQQQKAITIIQTAFRRYSKRKTAAITIQKASRGYLERTKKPTPLPMYKDDIGAIYDVITKLRFGPVQNTRREFVRYIIKTLNVIDLLICLLYTSPSPRD